MKHARMFDATVAAFGTCVRVPALATPDTVARTPALNTAARAAVST